MTSTRLNAFTLLALFILLAATLGAAYLNIGILHTPVAMLISIVKTGLILLIFMNLRRATPLILVASAAGFFWLLILISLTLGDYLTRN